MDDTLTAKPKYGFVRNTHDDKGEYRKDMDEYWNSVLDTNKEIFAIFHWLYKDKPITIYELVDIICKDEVNFETKPSIGEVRRWLVFEIQLGLIKVVEL